MTEIFGFSLPLLTLVLLCGLFLVFCYQMYFYCRYINGIIRYRNKIRKGKVTFLDEKPGVSIIICSKNEADVISMALFVTGTKSERGKLLFWMKNLAFPLLFVLKMKPTN